MSNPTAQFPHVTMVESEIHISKCYGQITEVLLQRMKDTAKWGRALKVCNHNLLARRRALSLTHYVALRKALMILDYCVRKGSPRFKTFCRLNEDHIRTLVRVFILANIVRRRTNYFRYMLIRRCFRMCYRISWAFIQIQASRLDAQANDSARSSPIPVSAMSIIQLLQEESAQYIFMRRPRPIQGIATDHRFHRQSEFIFDILLA